MIKQKSIFNIKQILVFLMIFLSIFFVACGKEKPPIVNDKLEVDNNKSMEEIVEDDIEDSIIVMENLKENVSIFGEIEENEFIWRTVNGQISVSGVELKTPTKTSDIDGVMPFFIAQGFVEDSWNIADGTISYTVGYQKGNTVCTMVVDLGEEHDIFSQEPSKADVTVNCGMLD